MTDDDTLLFRQKMISFRNENKLTQEELGVLIGASKNTIYNYENSGKIPPNKVKMLESLFLNYDSRSQKKETESQDKETINKEYIDMLFRSEYFQGRLTSFIESKNEVKTKNSLKEIKAEVAEFLKEVTNKKLAK